MHNAGIRIAHSLAVFEMRDCSPTVNDRHAPASGASWLAQACGIATPTREDLARIDRKRQGLE
jgi:hypothetical protein